MIFEELKKEYERINSSQKYKLYKEFDNIKDTVEAILAIVPDEFEKKKRKRKNFD